MKFFKYIILLLIATQLSSCFVKNPGKITTQKDTKQEKKELNFKYYFFEANKQKMLGNADLAIEYFLKCNEFLPNEAAPYYELAGIYTAKGDLDAAMQFAEKANKLNPKNKWYKIMIADIAKRQGNLKRTVEILQELTKQYPDDTNYKLELANTYLLMNKPQEALKEYEKIENKLGKSEEISYQKERIYEKIGDSENSKKELQNLIKLNPAEANYYGMLAESYLSEGKYVDAKKIYDKLLEVSPKNGIAFLSLSEYYRLTNNPDSSFIYIKKSFASDDVPMENKIRILLNNFANDKQKLLELLSILEKKYPDDARTYLLKSDFLIKDKRDEEAINEIRKALEIDKNNRNAWEQLLIIENNLRKYDDLENDSKKAIEYYPNYPVFYFYNGLANYENKKCEKTISVLETGIFFVMPKDKQLRIRYYILLGNCYNALKKYDKSDSYFEKILEIEPHNFMVLNNYSYYLAIRGKNLDKAEEMSKKVIDNVKDIANYYDTYAWILFKKGKYEKARKYQEKAINLLNNDNAAIFEHYGDILFKTGDIDKAVNYWKKAYLIENSEKLKNKITNKTL